MNRLALAVLLVIAPAVAAWAQEADSLRLAYSVSGKVSDAKSGKELSAVNIRVSGKQYATVSNADGVFVIKSDTPIRELVFSHLGYKTLRQTVTDGDVQARLTPDKYLLDPSTLVYGEPMEIIRSARAAIGENYPVTPELLQGFYRETLQKRSRHISVTEAVIRLYKSSYDLPGYKDRTAVDKSRIIMSQRRRDTLSVKMMGGPTLGIAMDAVKKHKLLWLDFDRGYYSCEMAQPEYIGDRLQFVIRFSPSGEADYPLYNGTLFIDRETLAFTRIEMETDMSKPDQVTQMLLVKKPKGLRFTPKEVNLVITYRPDGGKSRMEYLRATMSFDCDWKKRGIATGYRLVNETVITDVLTPAVPITPEEQFRSSDVMTDKASEFIDPAFWKDYNIIAPTESLEHAVGRLRKE